MDDLGVDYSRAGILLTVIGLMSAAFGFFGSYFLDRFGPKKTLSIALCVMIAGTLLIMISKSYAILFTGRLITGVGIGLSSVLPAAFYSMWFPSREKPFINSMHNAFLAGAQTVAYMVVIPIFIAVGSWQMTLGSFGFLALAITALFEVFGRDNDAVLETKAREKETAPDVSGKRQSGLGAAIKHKEIILLAVSTICALWTYVSFNTYLPAYLQEARGMDKAAASFMTGFAPLIGIGGALAGGFLIGISGRRKPFLILCYAMVLLGALGILFVPTGPLLYVCIGVMGFGNASWGPIFMTIPMDLKGSTPSLVGASIAICSGIGQGMTFVASMLFNAFVLTFGLGNSLLIYAMPVIVSIICGILMPETGPKGKQQEAVV
jgi:cyanate permease